MKYLIHRDQVHRDVYFDPLSIALLNTPQMQRLGRIYQLGFTHLVYRGGTHTRLSHVMGASYVAESLVNALRKNYEIAEEEGSVPKGAILPEDFLPNTKEKGITIEDRWNVLLHLVKWGALLHDLGHIPIGHTLEDEFSGIYLKHDSFTSPRMAYLWNEESPGKNSAIKQVLMDHDLYPKSFHNLKIRPSDVWKIVMLICLYKEKDKDQTSTPPEQNSFEAIYQNALIEHSGSQFHQYMADIVADTICADYIDYLQRDTLNVGLDPVEENRIIQSYFIGKDASTQQLRMALSLRDKGGKPKLSTTTAAKNMVRHRFDLAEIIYYHKTKVSASAMMAKVFSLIDKPKEVAEPRVRISLEKIDEHIKALMKEKDSVNILKSKYMPDSLLDPNIGDETLIMWMQEKAWAKAALAKEQNDTETLRSALLSLSLLEGIIERRLYKVAISINSELVGKLAGTTQAIAVEKKIDGMLATYRKSEKAAIKRDHLERLMSEAAQWPYGSFLAYLPGRKAQAKGIETGALDDNGEVITLGNHSTVEQDVVILNDAYKNLWRFLIFVHPKYRNNSIELSDAIDKLLNELFPGIDCRVQANNIKEACWFSYIPQHNRDAAKVYSDLNIGQSANIKWSNFEAAKRSSSGTIDSKEHAYRAKLLDYVEIKEIKRYFDQPGSLHKSMRNQIQTLQEAESKKGEAEKENIIVSLEAIAKKIKNHNKSAKDPNNLLF